MEDGVFNIFRAAGTLEGNKWVPFVVVKLHLVNLSLGGGHLDQPAIALS